MSGSAASLRLAHAVGISRPEAEALLEHASLELMDAQLSCFTSRHRLGAAVEAGVISARAVCGLAGVDVDVDGKLEVLLAAAGLLALGEGWRAEARALQHPQRIDEEEVGHAIVWAREIYIDARLYVMGVGA
ncbi:MAG TPA: hypothetical protein VFA39_20060 [Steroidobacteraceae bacterium]|nr:hypothetical protein [Steroidobacteraceae bacterium]